MQSLDYKYQPLVSWKLVVPVGDDLLKANKQNELLVFVCDVTLTDYSTRGVLKSIDWLQ